MCSLQKLCKTLTFQWIDNASILLLSFLLLKQWISVNFLIILSSALFSFFFLFFSLQYHTTEWQWQHNQLSSSILFLLVLFLASNSQHYLTTKSQASHFSFYVSHLINILLSQHKSSQNWQLWYHHHVWTLLMHYSLADTDSRHWTAATAEIDHFYIFSEHVTVSCFIHWWQWVHRHSIQIRVYHYLVREVKLSNISYDTYLNLQSFSSEWVFSA